VAAAAGVSAAGLPVGDGAGQGEGETGEAGGDLGGDGCGLGLLGRGGRHAAIVAAGIGCLARSVEHKRCMDNAENAEVAAYIGRWRPSSVPPPAAAFARDVIAKTGPEGRERAKNLLWAAGKLAGYGIGLGLDAVPEVLLHPSVTERFTRCAPGLSGVARRTLRTNLRFIGRRVVPQLYPRICRCPGSGPRSRTAPRRSLASLRWRTPSPPRSGGCARPGWSAWAPAPG
jgi:hypothetical protein